ncbi:MAG: peptidase [Thermoleophilia bacterium]|nr:peptidase [Thermoleophilia bacterium]
MTARRRICTSTRGALRRRSILLALAATALVLPHSALAAGGTPAVSNATATPAAFVPDWDGHTDSTVIAYTILERSIVTVRIVDAQGRTVATIDTGLRPAGTHLASWDGRDTAGEVRAAGTYRVQVDGTPRPAAPIPGEPGAAELGGGVVIAGGRVATITLQRAPVAIRGVRLTRASIGRARRVAGTSARFELSAPASISAAIVNQRGIAVRTLVTGRMRAGVHTIAWDGRRTGGASLPDGDYALAIAAGGSGRPTATTRLPLHVDRRLPMLRATKRVAAKASSTGLHFGLVAVVSEPATLTVRAGARSARFALAAAGTHRISVPAASLGIVAGTKARSVAVHVVAVDAAGNAVSSTTTVVVPRVTRTTTARPPATPPSGGGGGAVSAAGLQWPITTIPINVVSPFGMRWGRPHTGLDIAAPSGTPIHPAASGTVAFVGVYGGYGNVVMVDHPASGLRTYYAHMSAFGRFGVGDHVDHLDVIGNVGCTGHCTGPHLHFETRVGAPPNDVPRDPVAYLPAH